jgi:hypothetical protein
MPAAFEGFGRTNKCFYWENYPPGVFQSCDNLPCPLALLQVNRWPDWTAPTIIGCTDLLTVGAFLVASERID